MNKHNSQYQQQEFETTFQKTLQFILQSFNLLPIFLMLYALQAETDVLISNYNIFRNDKATHRGGVCI